MRGILLALAWLLASAQAPAPIGVATMEQNGTIVLDLRGEGPGRQVGHGRITYPPDHRDYRAVLDHLGGLQPGERKPVPPWPDDAPRAR